jgi:hypothetical protein
LELDSKFVIVDAEVAIPVADYRLRHHRLHFLRYHADVALIAAIIAEAIVTKAIGKMAEEGDIVLESDIGPPAATAAESTAAAATKSTAAGTTEAAAAEA